MSLGLPGCPLSSSLSDYSDPDNHLLRFRELPLQGHRAGLQSLLTESAQPRLLELRDTIRQEHTGMCVSPASGRLFLIRLKLALGFPDLVLFTVQRTGKATWASVEN